MRQVENKIWSDKADSGEIPDPWFQIQILIVDSKFYPILQMQGLIAQLSEAGSKQDPGW